jgi:hypothetical protein
MNGSADPAPAEPVDLQREVEKRKTWFYECQLRWLNLGKFHDVTEAVPDPRIDLISEPLHPDGQMGVQMKSLGQVYLDDKEPVWTPDEIARRNAFADGFIGRTNNWLGYKSGKKLADKLTDLKKKYEASVYSSEIDLDPELNKFGRKDTGTDANSMERSMGRAISRAMLAKAKPWLIPELYKNAENAKLTPIENWIGSLETFVGNFEADLRIAVGWTPGQSIQPDPLEEGDYRARIKSLIESSSSHNTADSLTASMLTQHHNPPDPSVPLRLLLFELPTYEYKISIQTPGYPMGLVDDFPFSQSVKYWTGVVKNALGEVYVNKPNADMGLCHIMRIVYLLGTLPATLGSDADLRWRKRAAPDDGFVAFFSKKGDDPALKGNEALQKRFQAAQTKLQVILEETAAHPRSAAPTFSPLAQEVIRQALHSFKFWMDEPFRVSSNDLLIKARTDTKIASGKELEAEMEYWSENHYIMFASSEFLAGQLWETDQFQPGKEFLAAADSKSGILTGKERKERGKARVLKWLNNRLMFGWMEFHSSGYYREHLWSLLNLADFSLDREVRDKAVVAIDLLLFDVARYLHKGTMGAAGGRSQFNSKSSGWDNALCDVVEILFGPRGVFGDGDGQIGAAISSSTYKAPDVLLEIGTHPPMTPFTDRSRVSVTFEEAPKYGIGYSQKSDQKDSVMDSYAPKRARYYPFVDSVNQEIARTHTDYGATEDDTVFWWGTSAYYHKQIVRNTFNVVKTFGLEKCPVFGALRTLIKLVSAYEKAKHGLIGGLIGSISGPVGAIAGAAIGFFEDDVFNASTLEAASDDLSVLIEGSTRTRANILSFRTPDIMLSSIQNFRAGQLNFQSSVCMASLNPAVNVFTTAGLEDIDISDLDAAIGGGLLGAALGAAFGGAGAAILGAAAAIIGNEAALKHEDLGFVDPHDGPGWWTGSWALPMIVQHDSAAILAYDYHTIQNLLAQSGSHTWFPKTGFDRVDEMRTSAYDDANFPLLDIGDIGPKGFWLFGKIIHPAEGNNEPREAYIGVFSNQRPKWLDQGSDLYKRLIKKSVRKPITDMQDNIKKLLEDLGDDDSVGYTGQQVIQIVVERSVNNNYAPNITRDAWLKKVTDELAASKAAILLKHVDKTTELAGLYIDLKNLQRIWPDPLPQDYFADRDWYVEGKNVWIVQVGSREEFGDFQSFKDRVSSARIHLDDSGDLECTYDIPRGDGSSERLTLAYGDGGRFGLNGSPFQTDFYPRFENPFVRGGRVEWGQREYVIEYRGKSLLHDFSNFDQPARLEQASFTAEERNLVKALVIFLKTGDEDMDTFTVATADVGIGCDLMTKEQVVAAGPVDENTYHDVEWIFFDFQATRNPDMTLLLTHPASSKGDDTPHWKMSFSLFALMGDRIVRPCSLSYSYFEFKDDKRTAPRFPFSIALFEWRSWDGIKDHKSPTFWMIGRHPDFTRAYFDYSDLLAIDPAGQLWHRRLKPCAAEETGWFTVTQGKGSGADEPDLSKTFFAVAVSAEPATLYLAVQSQGMLFASQPSPSGAWTEGWKHVDIWIFPDKIFGIPDTSGAPIPVSLSGSSPVAGNASSSPFGGVELTVLGADGNFYSRTTLQPVDTGAWRRIEVGGFAPLFGAEFVVIGDFLLVLAGDRSLWVAVVDHSVNHIAPTWEKVTPADFAVSRFTAASLQGSCQIMVATTFGGVRAATYRPGSLVAWFEIDLPGIAPAPGSPLASAAPTSEQAKFFATGGDGKVYSVDWKSSVDWMPGMSWSEVAPDGKGIEARITGGIAAVSRVNGQVEIFAQSKDSSLVKTWWS